MRPTHPHRWLRKRLEEWQAEGLIDAKTAATLRERYPAETGHAPLTWMTAILGIFGSLLIMGGVILLFAHNWHDLSRLTRTGLAVAPLLVFQGLAAWVLGSRGQSAAWREGVAVGLTLSIGAAIALIAQTYQLGGDFGRFMLTWVGLSIPVVYLLRSGTALWLTLAGAVLYAVYRQDMVDAAPGFFLLYLAVVPFAVWAHRAADRPTLAALSRWALALAFWAGVPFALDYHWEGAWLPLLALAAGTMILWDRPARGPLEHLGQPPFAFLASLFVGGLLLSFSFHEVWEEFGRGLQPWSSVSAPSVALAAALLAAWGGGLIRRVRQGQVWPALLGGLFPVLATLGWLLAGNFHAALPLMLATNAIGLAIGIAAIVQALRDQRLALLNYGLFLIGGLVLLRFFDADLGSVARGLGFISLGGGFLLANFLFLRHRRAHPQLRELHA